jgi:hypothetical protein
VFYVGTPRANLTNPTGMGYIYPELTFVPDTCMDRFVCGGELGWGDSTSLSGLLFPSFGRYKEDKEGIGRRIRRRRGS